MDVSSPPNVSPTVPPPSSSPPTEPIINGPASQSIAWMRQGLGVDFDPEQIDLDEFARELDRLGRAEPADDKAPQGSQSRDGEEAQRTLIGKIEALERTRTEVMKLEAEVRDLKRRSQPSTVTTQVGADSRSTEPDGVNLADGSSPNFRDGNEDDMWGQGG